MKYTEDKLFCELVAHVVNLEGGYVNDPDDSGGPTKYGISWNNNVAALKALGIMSPYMVRDLTQDEAKQIYYWKYWLASGAHTIPEKRLAYTHFDAAVNQGVGAAASFLSRLSRQPKYFAAGGANQALWWQLFVEYNNLRHNAYSHSRSRKKHLEGWVNRMVGVVNFALKML